MQTLAVCLYSNSTSLAFDSTTLNDLKTISREYAITIFRSDHANKFAALLDVSTKKRGYEINNCSNFDVCMAVDVEFSWLIGTQSKISPPPPNTIMFAQGGYIQSAYTTVVDPAFFYSDTLSFDRACEYVRNLPNIDPNWFRYRGNVDDNVKFYYHLKSIMLNTRCTNVENSCLFVRST